MDREPDFRDNNSDIEAWTSCESGFSNKDQEQDADILYGGENGFSTKD